MPIRIQSLFEEDKESYDTLRDLCCSIFLDGECYAFATALHRGLDWPMIGLMNGDEVRHVAVQSPDGRLHDVRGYISEEEFGQPFGLSYPYILKVVNEDDLLRDNEPHEVRENTIRRARKLSEAIWPELPWKDTFALRVSAFADELEALSRKHKLWIRSPVPASRSVIAIGDDDEGGYDLRPTFDGVTFTIDRYFKQGGQMKTLLVTSGPRGGGKSTYVEAVKERHPHLPIVSRDKIRVELFGSTGLSPYTCDHEIALNKMLEELKHALSSNEPSEIVLLDCWNGYSRDRKHIIKTAKELGADKVYCLQFVLPVHVCIEWFMSKSHTGGLSEYSVRRDYELYYKTAENIEEDGFDSIFLVNPCQLRFENIPFI